MSTITFGDVSLAYDALQSLDKEMFDGLTAAKIVRLRRWMKPHWTRWICARQEAVKSHGRQLGNDRWEVKEGAGLKEYLDDMKPLEEEEISLDEDLYIDLDAFDGILLTIRTYEALEPFIRK